MSILREEFNSIKIIHDGLTLSEALNKLVPHLTSEQACEALATANGISNKLLRSQVLDHAGSGKSFARLLRR